MPRPRERRGLRPAVLGLVAVVGTVVAAPLSAQQTDSVTLARALTEARARSPALAEAGAAIRQVIALEDVAAVGNRPRIIATGAYLRFQDPPALALGGPDSYSPFLTNGFLLQVGVDQPIYTGGRVTQEVEAAAAAVRAAELRREATDVALTAAVAHAHDDALLARELLEVAESAARVLRDARRVAEEHFAAGTVSRLDVLRAETRLAMADARLREAADADSLALTRLAVLLGHDDAALTVTGDLAFDASVAASTVVRSAIDRVAEGPDIEATRRAADEFAARARAADAARRPTLNVFASALTTRPELVTGRERWDAEWLAGVYVTWPILDWGVSAASARAASSAASRAIAQADGLTLKARGEMRAALRALDRAARDVATGRDNISRSELALAIAQERYTDGIGIQLEVLEAATDVETTQADLLRAVHAHRSALIEIKRLAGLPADAPPTPGGGDR